MGGLPGPWGGSNGSGGSKETEKTLLVRMVKPRKFVGSIKSLDTGSTAETDRESGDEIAPRKVLDTILRVTTPENISFQYQIAGPFRRSLAYLLDIIVSIFGFILLAIAINLLFAWVFIPLAAAMGLGSFAEAFMGVLSGLSLVSYFVVYWFYGAWMETYFNGQTLGKRWTRMRVLSTNGHSIDGVQATLRNFFRLLDIAPVVSFTALLQLEEPVGGGIPTCLFGLIMMTISKKYQRVGDLVAGTIVVHESTRREPDLAVFTDARVPGLAGLIPPGFSPTPSMATAIADYVDQRRYLPYPRAAEIAGHLAGPLLKKFDLLPDTDHDLFICALYHKTFIASQASDDDEGLQAPGGRSLPAEILDTPTATLAEQESS